MLTVLLSGQTVHPEQHILDKMLLFLPATLVALLWISPHSWWGGAGSSLLGQSCKTKLSGLGLNGLNQGREGQETLTLHSQRKNMFEVFSGLKISNKECHLLCLKMTLT